MQKKIIFVISTICTYIVIYIIALVLYELPLDNRFRLMNYTLIWVAKEHLFCFVWLLAIFFIIRKRYITSIGTTIGCMIGIILGELIGTYLKYMEILRIGYEYRYRAYHYGAFIWFIICIASILFSYFIDRKSSKKDSVK